MKPNEAERLKRQEIPDNDSIRLYLQKYVKDIIQKTPTGGHYDAQWWISRYSDLQNKKAMKDMAKGLPFHTNIKLDFSFQDLMNEVLIYYSKNKTAVCFLTTLVEDNIEQPEIEELWL